MRGDIDEKLCVKKPVDQSSKCVARGSRPAHLLLPALLVSLLSFGFGLDRSDLELQCALGETPLKVNTELALAHR